MSDDDLLSQEEKEALLKGVEEGDVSTDAHDAPAGEIRPFNFAAASSKLLDRFTRLNTVNELLLAEIVESLTRTFRSEPRVRLEGVQTRPMSDYVASLGEIASIAVCSMAPLKGQWLFVIEPRLLYILVDRYFGGKGKAPASQRGAVLTLSETRVAEQMTANFLNNLKTAWSEVIEVTPDLVELESNPDYLSLPITDDPAIQISFSIALAEDEGLCHFVIPYAMLEPVKKRFGLATVESTQSTSEWAGIMTDRLRIASVELRAELSSLTLTVQQLLDLVPGDVIPIKSPDDVIIKVGGIEIFEGKFGTADGQNAVKITHSELEH